MAQLTIVTLEGASTVGTNAVGGRLRVPPGDIARALGWELKPEGFCCDDLCYPVPEGSDLVDDNGVDLQAFAELLDRPLALDTDERAAFLGSSPVDRAGALAGGQAPDFTLPDLEGNLHSLSDHRAKKVLLAVYASW